MSGLDSILAAINEKGVKTADEIIKSAEKKAEGIRLTGEKAAEESYADYIDKFRQKCEKEYAAACSGAESSARREILLCRSECIEKAVENAVKKIEEMSVSEYFTLITKMVGNYMRKGSGVISFGKRDLERMPKNFEKNLKLLAVTDGSDITVSDKAADISSGFILTYGDISENCSFRAIIEAEKDYVRDTAAAILFG
jgi:V/A-type H+-transporting ATPase subunit E